MCSTCYTNQQICPMPRFNKPLPIKPKMNLIIQKTQSLLNSLSQFFYPKPSNQPNNQLSPNMHFTPLSQHKDYQLTIKPILQQIAQGQLQNHQIIHQLQLFQKLTLIHQQLPNDFAQLKALKEDIVPIFTQIAQQILSQEEHYKSKKLNILLQSKNDQVHFNKQDILYLMSLMAMNLVPPQPYNQLKGQNSKKRHFPFPYDFADIFSDQEYKTKTVIEYFRHHLIKHNSEKQPDQQAEQKFTIQRKYLAQKIQEILEKHRHSPMSPYELKPDTESIQNFTGHIKVDFANKYIGGGALSAGCVQEEIMFANHPELFTSVLFCQMMNDHEAIFFNGFKKYSKNTGYGWNTKYDAQEKITQDFHKQNQYIVAIDALHFPSSKNLIQKNKQTINRQLKKAYVGFSDLPEGTDVVTGNWGCGAFNGDVRIKFMIQWLACSMARRKMVYCPFGHRNKIAENEGVLKELQKKQIGEVYDALVKGGQKMKQMQDNIFVKMKESL